MTELKFVSLHSTEEKDYQDYISWEGTYFHGNLESYVNSIINKDKNYKGAPDLVASNKYSWNYKDGIYSAFCYEKPATLYIWRIELQPMYKLVKGLIVDPTSLEDVAWAEEKFNSKSFSL